MALEELEPADLLGARERFDKVVAMNVNLFWVRSPAEELELIRRLLVPGGALYLFYGYGGSTRPGNGDQDASRMVDLLTGHLAEHGFAVEVKRGPGVVGVVATIR